MYLVIDPKQLFTVRNILRSTNLEAGADPLQALRTVSQTNATKTVKELCHSMWRRHCHLPVSVQLEIYS